MRPLSAFKVRCTLLFVGVIFVAGHLSPAAAEEGGGATLPPTERLEPPQDPNLRAPETEDDSGPGSSEEEENAFPPGGCPFRQRELQLLV